MKKSSRQLAQLSGMGLPGTFLAEVARTDRYARLVLVVEIAGVEDIDLERLRVARGARRQHDRPRRAAVVVVADVDDEIGAVLSALRRNHAERPHFVVTIAHAGLRLALGLPAAAAVAQHDDPARRRQ